MKKLFKYFAILFFFIGLIFTSYMLLGRPGGGHSYSGGSYGDGGGGDGSGLASLIVWVFFDLLPPEVSIPLLILLFIGYKIYEKKHKYDTSHILSSPSYENIIEDLKHKSAVINQIKNLDPNFSRIIFLDFVHLLYTKYYALVGNPTQRKTLIPFFANSELLKKQALINGKISEVVVGSLDIKEAQITDTNLILTVQINANYTLTVKDKSTRYIVKERWKLSRDKNLLSPEPEKMQTLRCPKCGAPADFNDAGYCNSCGELIVPGKHQWSVLNIAVIQVETLRTTFLTGYSYERGTELPTIFDPNLQENIQIFARAHNVNFSEYWQKFENKVVRPYFFEIYKHWSQLKWNKVRHLLTDRLWEAFNFWIEAYKQAGLQNKLDDTQIEKVILTKLEIDKFYEAFTVRIFAKSKDYIVNKQGKVIAGYNRAYRYFSEYWTFIRRAGVENDDYDMKTCPNCGAPADKIGQSGICEYCGAKITTGEFSWVLAIITQDEEYTG